MHGPRALKIFLGLAGPMAILSACSDDHPPEKGSRFSDFSDCSFTSLDRPWTLDITEIRPDGSLKAELAEDDADDDFRPIAIHQPRIKIQLRGKMIGDLLTFGYGSDQTTYRAYEKNLGQCALERISGPMQDRFFVGLVIPAGDSDDNQ